jgi:bifunctional non-homologous end joining protein LigD
MIQTADLFYSDIAAGGTSDKEYHLQLVPAATDGLVLVNFQYGRRGGPLTSGTKTPNPVPLAEGEKVFQRLLKEKTGKGYKPSTNGSSPAPTTPVGAGESAGETPCELLEEVTEEEARHLIRDDVYSLQTKKDGVRRQVRKDATGEIVGINRRGLVVPVEAKLLAELKLIPLKTFLIDGELVGDKLWAFDLLDANGDRRSVSYVSRFDALARVLGDTERQFISGGALQHIRIVPNWFGTTEKQKAYEELKADRAEGVVFKLLGAPYRVGKNGQHKKFKFVKTLTAKVLAVRENGKDSVTLGLAENGGWLTIGRTTAIGQGPYQVGDLVEVRYLYATEGRQLFQSVLLGRRDDITEAECTVSQLVFKQGVNGNGD